MTHNESESESESDNEMIETGSVHESIAESTSSSKRISKKKKVFHQAIQPSDPDYHVIHRHTGKKMKEIAIYSTHCNPGRLIRDPVFGTRTNDRVGSLAERSYFRVRMTTVGDGSEPVTLYYDCPEAYEKHLYASVSHETKKEWRGRQNL